MKKILVVLAVTLLLSPGSSEADLKEEIIESLQSIQGSLNDLLDLVAENTTEVTTGTSEGTTGSSEDTTGSSEGSTGSSEGSTGSSEGSTGSSEGSTGSSEGTTSSSTVDPNDPVPYLRESSAEDVTFCTIANDTDPEDLCSRLNDVLNNIKSTTEELAQNQIGEEQKVALSDSDKELKDVVTSAEEDEAFLESLVTEELNAVVTEMNKTISDAIDTVDNYNDDPGNDSKTLAIVLGTLGGVLGLVLIGVGGFMLFKKKKSKAKKRSSRSSDHSHGNTGYRMDED